MNHQIKVYSKEALWNKIYAWFNGNAEPVIPSLHTFLEEQGTLDVAILPHTCKKKLKLMVTMTIRYQHT